MKQKFRFVVAEVMNELNSTYFEQTHFISHRKYFASLKINFANVKYTKKKKIEKGQKSAALWFDRAVGNKWI